MATPMKQTQVGDVATATASTDLEHEQPDIKVKVYTFSSPSNLMKQEPSYTDKNIHDSSRPFSKVNLESKT